MGDSAAGTNGPREQDDDAEEDEDGAKPNRGEWPTLAEPTELALAAPPP